MCWCGRNILKNIVLMLATKDACQVCAGWHGGVKCRVTGALNVEGAGGYAAFAR